MAAGLCSCASEEATGPLHSETDAEARASATSTSQDGGLPPAFDSQGLLSCQSTGPAEILNTPACSDKPLDCDAALAQELEQLMDACSYRLNENWVEFFFEKGCVKGLTLGRPDAVKADAQRCVSEGLGRMRADCAQALCVHFEHSTLASL